MAYCIVARYRDRVPCVAIGRGARMVRLARDSVQCVRDSAQCAHHRPVTVHCLGHCSWTLYTNTIHGHCSKKKKGVQKRPPRFGASHGE